uniref:Tubulin--tyrosine ligase-like protein 5 n=1 Tax=Alexandrium monilatum TaxID=311494 RepID=A0A7S4W7Q2_9DINO
MDSPRAGLWRHVPGYDSDDSDDDWGRGLAEEEKEDVASAKQRYQEIMSLLGDRWVDPPVHGFSPAQVRKKGEKVMRGEVQPRSGPLPCFRMERMLAPVVHDTFISNGFSETHGSDWCIQWSGPGMKDSAWSDIHEYQRVNHFPGSTALTRKDSMYMHLSHMAKNFGNEAFDFLPETYVLPEDMKAFMEEYERKGGLWIVKPTNSACGRGIFILRNIRDLPSGSSVVSQYVDNPLLIQGLKFDLRVYVMVTQYDPLRAYIYREGLARFASKPYSTEEEHLQDAYRHLTNYSINKSAPNFMENQDLNEDNYGHKWSLSALNRHLRCVGVDHRTMWSRIMDLIVKTLLAVEPVISERTRRCTMHQGVCFEIYGFDVLVDEDLKPWILEVNLSPSMQAESPLDWQVKSSLLSDAFNIIGVCRPELRAIQASRLRGQIAQARAAHKALIKERGPNSLTGLGGISPKRNSTDGKRFSLRKPITGVSPLEVPVVFDTLTESQLKMLARSLQEFDRCQNFIRLFPTRGAVERYRPIVEARGRYRSAYSLTGSNHLLASLLFGPPPRKSSSSSAMLSPQLQETTRAREKEAAGLGSSFRKNYVASLQRSLIALQLQRPVYSSKRAVASDDRAVSPLQPPEVSELEDSPVDGSGRDTSESPRQHSAEREEKAPRVAHAMTDLNPMDRHRLVLMEYLGRVVRACESLSTEERASLAQSGAFSRLSGFRSRLRGLSLQYLQSTEGGPLDLGTTARPDRPTSGRDSLVGEVMGTCRSSLEALALRPWSPDEEDDAETPPEEADHRGALAGYLPEGFGLAGPRRQALSVLPVLGPAELEGILRSDGHSEESGAWSQLFGSVESTGRPYSPLRDILQVRRRSRPARDRSRSASKTQSAATLDAEELEIPLPARPAPELRVSNGTPLRSRQAPSRHASVTWSETPSPPPLVNVMTVPAPDSTRKWSAPLLPDLKAHSSMRQLSAPLLPDIKASERPKLISKQAFADRVRHQLVSSSLGRQPVMFEMDSIEL